MSQDESSELSRTYLSHLKLFNIARTTLSSKVLSQDKDYFANLAVDAVLRLQVLPPFRVNLIVFDSMTTIRDQPT